MASAEAGEGPKAARVADASTTLARLASPALMVVRRWAARGASPNPARTVVPAESPNTVIAYHIGSLGDAIVTMPALAVVRRRYASARLVLLSNAHRHGRAPVAARTVLEGSGLVDHFMTYEGDARPRDLPAMIVRLVRDVRRLRPSVAVYLAPSERPARAITRDRLFFRLCGVREWIGFHEIPRGDLSPRDADGRPGPVPREAVRKLARLAKDGLAAAADALTPPFFHWTPEETAAARRWLDPRRVPGRALVAVCATSNMSCKIWPADRFIDIGRRLIAQADVDLLVVGGAGDREIGDRLIAGWGRGLNSAGVFPFREAGALLGQCDLHLGLDAGSTHLAAAAGVRCVVVASDRDYPGQWDPLGTGHIIVRHRVACGGCLAVDCPVPGHPCIADLTAGDVWRAIEAGGVMAHRSRGGEA
jgi:heptosyltransferase-3